jgi:hypothetical protein
MSEIKVNKISPRTNCGTVTLGDSGDTFSIPAGVTLTNSGTATGFGPTGAVSWDTTAVTSSPLTAASGVGYFIDTSGGAITVNLPAGSAGAIISLADYTNTWQTNAVTVNANGSEKIGGVAAPATLNTEGQSVTFIYVDSTEGWKNVQDSTSNVTGNPFIVATGGTITCDGDYKVHTFTGPGDFIVTNAGSPSGSNTVDYLVVAGGGGGSGGFCQGASAGAGGAGGYRQNFPSPAVAGLPVTATTYTVVVGAGGAGVPGGARSGSGTNSVFSTITSTGGGGGGSWNNINCAPALTGGSGGGGGGRWNVWSSRKYTPSKSTARKFRRKWCRFGWTFRWIWRRRRRCWWCWFYKFRNYWRKWWSWNSEFYFRIFSYTSRWWWWRGIINWRFWRFWRWRTWR